MPRPTHLSSKSPFKVVSLYQADLNPPLCHISLSALPYPHLYLCRFGSILNESGPLRFKETVLSAVRSVWGRSCNWSLTPGRELASGHWVRCPPGLASVAVVITNSSKDGEAAAQSQVETDSLLPHPVQAQHNPIFERL